MATPIINQQEFINRCNHIHNNVYDYSLTTYVGMVHSINIICKIHGQFTQRASSHADGKGCIKCARNKRNKKLTKSPQTIIQQMKNRHGETYDYSKMHYTNAHTPVEIICRTHGSFFPLANDHIRGAKCIKCIKDQQRLSLKQFIQKSQNVHGLKYDYSLVNYINNSTNVDIICPTHGEFHTLPTNHMKGHGCGKCAANLNAEHNRHTTEWFIDAATKVHNRKYTYSKSIYFTHHQKVIITCPIHGDFEQAPNNHVSMKQGCPKCVIGGRYSEAWFLNNPNMQTVNSIVYLLEFTKNNEKFWKVGLTRRSVKERWAQKNGSYTIREVFKIEGPLLKMFRIEQHILKNFVYRRRYNPDILIGGDHECFVPKSSDPKNWVQLLIDDMVSLST